MHKVVLTLVFLHSFSVSAFSKVIDKGVYGEDDRYDYFEIKDEALRGYSDAVAAQVYDTNFDEIENGSFLYNYPLYGEIGPTKMCSSERYLEQQVGINCTGFLIAPDVLVTAGHCVKTDEDCQDFKWAFDHKYSSSKLGALSYSEKQLVRCEKVLARAFTENSGLDYAILKLEKKMEERTPLKFRKKGVINADANLLVIGFPAGLPMKFTLNGKIRNNNIKYQMILETDTFHGNSGSPVINTKTGEVEGILVRGGDDYKKSSDESCREVVKVGAGLGRGEDVIRITELPLIKKL